MRFGLLWRISATILPAACCLPAPASPKQGKIGDLERVPGRVIVAFTKDVAFMPGPMGIPSSGRSGIDRLNARFRVRRADPVFRGRRHGPSEKPPNVRVLAYSAKADPRQVAKAYARLPEVRYAEPDYICHAFRTDPNDPSWLTWNSWGQGYRDQWDMEKMACPEAWDIQQGSASVVVAVIDTGIDYTHPDIQANTWQNPGEIAGNGIDDDGNGYIDDLHGYDFAYSDGDPMDGQGHGTHVAGTIGAVGNNGIGIAGINWACRLMALKGLDDDGYGASSHLAAAIRYAADEGARIINMSWGGPGSSTTIHEAIVYAHGQNVVLCAAAGNESTNIAYRFPAGDNYTLAVAASDQNDATCYFSNWGTKIAVSAPGGNGQGNDPCLAVYNILSLRSQRWQDSPSCILTVGSNLLRLGGTSMACPHAAGLAALLVAQRPEWTNEQVRQAIQMRADDIMATGFDRYAGFGRVNAYKALQSPEPMTAFITQPSNADGLWGTVAVSGAADGPSLAEWILDYGVGYAPTDWTEIASGTTAVVGGKLADWDVTAEPQGTYTLRLRTNGSGDVQNAEYREQIDLPGPPPPGDFCSVPKVIESLPYQDTMSTLSATESLSDPLVPCADETVYHTVWYSLTPTDSTYIMADTSGSDYDTVLAVWTGGCDQPINAGCSDDSGGTAASRVIFAASAGTAYLIEVGSYIDGGGSTSVLRVVEVSPPPANDECSSPKLIGSLPYYDVTSTLTATSSPSDPVFPCVVEGRAFNTVWYSFTSGSTAEIQVDTVESNYNTVLGVFEGACGSLAAVACDDDSAPDYTSRAVFNAEAGVTYLISVGSYYDGGADSLTLNAAPAPRDYYTRLFNGDFDLENLSIEFAPDASPSFYSACTVPITRLPTDPSGGTNLPLGDESFALVSLADGAQVSLYGNSRDTFYVGSNGYITFDQGDAKWDESWYVNHFALKRVSGLFDDLDPSAGGSISWKQTPDRVAVSFLNVPVYGFGNSNTFQIEMFYDGRIVLSWLGVDTGGGLVGLSEGNGVPADFLERDLSAYRRCGVRSIVEAKRSPDGGRVWLSDQVVSAALPGEFYAQRPDRSMGIGVRWDGASPELGGEPVVFGTMTTVSGERMIEASAVVPGSGGLEPTPVGINYETLGGGGLHWDPGPPPTGQRGITGAIGLNNIGLLVKTWGKVLEIEDAISPTWFTLSCGTGDIIRVELPPEVDPPGLNEYVSVTGISSCMESGTTLVRKMKVRRQSDIAGQ